MIKYLRITLISFCFLIVGNINTMAQEIDGIAAVLEDYIILKSTIEGQYQQALASGEPLPADAKCLILDQLLLEKLFLAEAERDSIYVGEDDVNNELERRMGVFVNMFGSQEKLEEYYGKTVFELKEEFRADVRQQMLSEKMKGQIFTGLEVTPSEVQTFYEAIPKDSLPFFNAEVEIGQIVVFSKPTFAQKQIAREKAENIRKEILDGSDFGFQALLNSEDPGSANNRGELGWVKRGVFVPDFEAVAFRLKENEVSEVVETEFGFHIIQLQEKKGNRIKARHILITPKTDMTNSLAASDQMREIKTKLEEKTITFQQAVTLNSEDDVSKNNGGLLTNNETGNTFFEMDKLETPIALALDGLEVGDFSKILPFTSQRGKEGYRVIYLKSETPAHKASIETDYSKIKAVAKQNKQLEVMNEWIEDKSKTVYVKLNTNYTGCEALEKWMPKETAKF
ncbi:MAG: foldase protein PrsA [Chitinophagales bacterium]